MDEHAIAPPGAIIVMGVSGSGKSTIARRLAEQIGFRFIEGDDLHPAANVEKMRNGIALDDEDRWPWLARVGEALSQFRGEGVIITCSALKRVYRDRLRAAAGGTLSFVFLDGSKDLLYRRMGHRTGHFMPLSLLETQLATLERPEGEPGVVTVSIDQPLDAICNAARAGLAAALG